VFFVVPLLPYYLYYIAKELGVEPRDRLEIILEIFKLHSPSKEADLQIKLASLQYELARAKERVRLVKSGEQPALIMGPGAYEVDVYYNEIKRRIQNIKRKLEEERKKRELHRKYRKKYDYKTISITGYTSSGKTTLFNAITGLQMKTGAEPFTTITTKFSTIKIGPWDVYLVDTIGFISELPPFMINAFYSTLEEITTSDLILLVIDVSESYDEISDKIHTSFDIIKKLDYNGHIIIVGNKVDLINNPEYLNPIRKLFEEHSPYHIFISALRKANLDKLLKMIEEVLGEGRYVKILLPYSNIEWGRLLEEIKRHSKGGYKIDFLENGLLFEGYVDDRIARYLANKDDIKVLEGYVRDMDIETDT
jgi:GTP-binding protein HflX